MSLGESIFGLCDSILRLWMSILGLEETNLSLWELILDLLKPNLCFRNKFGLHDVEVGHLVGNFRSLELEFRHVGEFSIFRLIVFRALGVDHEPMGVDIWSLRVNSGPLGVDLGPLGVKFEPLEVNFELLRVDIRFSESIWAS